MPKFKVGDRICTIDQHNKTYIELEITEVLSTQYKYTVIRNDYNPKRNGLANQTMSIAINDKYFQLVAAQQSPPSTGIGTSNPLFKIGDIITDGSNYRDYEVRDYDQAQHQYALQDVLTAQNLGYVNASTVESLCKLKNYTKTTTGTPAMAAGQAGSRPLFDINNKVITKWGNELQIISMDVPLQLYMYKVIQSKNPLKVGTTDKETFAIAHSSWKLKAPEMKLDIRKCICDSRDLMNKGCKCGAINPYKAKLG